MFVTPKITYRTKNSFGIFKNNNSSWESLKSLDFFTRSIKKDDLNITSSNKSTSRTKSTFYIPKDNSVTDRIKSFKENNSILQSINITKNLRNFITKKLKKDKIQETDKMSIDHFGVDVNVCQLKLNNKNKYKLKNKYNTNNFAKVFNNMDYRKNYLTNVDKNQILNEFKNQTKSNFNNKYKISYPGFNQNKRENIIKFFNSLKTYRNFDLKTKFFSKINLSSSISKDNVSHIKINNDYIKNQLNISNADITKKLDSNYIVFRSFSKRIKNRKNANKRNVNRKTLVKNINRNNVINGYYYKFSNNKIINNK